MNLRELDIIARSVVNQPYGCGDKKLANNSESWAPYLRFLNACVKRYKPKLVVELGVYMATATCHMAIGCGQTFVIGVDKQFHPSAFDRVFEYPNIWLVIGDTVEAFPKVQDVAKESRIELLFIDSEHDGMTSTNEFNVYQPLFAEECLIVCDDILDPRMLEFWKWLPGDKLELHFLHPKLNESYPEPGFGVSIVRK